MLSSVVRIVATVQDPDYDAPWQGRSPTTIIGTGCVIEDGHILACAHAVANARYIELRRISSDDSCQAEIIAINHDCDLALLAVSDPRWLANAEPVRIGRLPAMRAPVYMFGASEGAHWIRDGIVSKIDAVRYTHSQRHLLAFTLDIDMTDSEGAGPVFDDDQLIGICVQKSTEEDRVGEVVPPPIIEAFLAGIRDNKPSRVPALGIATQVCQNARLRQHLQLPDDGRGVVVLDVDHGGSADNVLQRDDVIIAIEDIPIASHGTLSYAEVPPHRFDAIVANHHIGDIIDLEIIRKGMRQRVELTLREWLPLVPRSTYDQRPRYLVWGGLVFQPLTRDYLTTWDEWWNKAPKEFLNFYYLGRRTPDRHEVVVLTQIFADEINTGYAHLYNEAVSTVNGHAPRDFADFADRLERATGLVRIETTSGGIAILHADDVRRAMPRICARYQIPQPSAL